MWRLLKPDYALLAEKCLKSVDFQRRLPKSEVSTGLEHCCRRCSNQSHNYSPASPSPEQTNWDGVGGRDVGQGDGGQWRTKEQLGRCLYVFQILQCAGYPSLRMSRQAGLEFDSIMWFKLKADWIMRDERFTFCVWIVSLSAKIVS